MGEVINLNSHRLKVGDTVFNKPSNIEGVIVEINSELHYPIVVGCAEILNDSAKVTAIYHFKEDELVLVKK